MTNATETSMELVYLALFVAFWLLLAGMAAGCARLEGPKS
jgi:hypothetical protein